MNKWIIICLLLLSSCHKKGEDSHLLSVQLVDRNGQTETISQTLRVQQYEKQDFKKPQPYEKILRVFSKNLEGKNPSVLTTYHKNGQLFQYLEALDGRAHGAYIEYYESGTPRISAHVIEGTAELHNLAQSSWVFEGLCEVFFPDGTLQARFHYDKGKKEGLADYFYQEGTPHKTLHFVHDEPEGELKEFYPNGCVMKELFFSNGKQHGKALGFSKQGTLIQDELWDNDLLTEGLYYNPSGDPVSKIEKSSGIKTIYEDDILRTKVSYKQGKIEGAIFVYDPKGFLTSSYILENGLKEGEEVLYYSGTEKPKVSITWHQDQISGIVKTYYPSGALESQKTYMNNRKNGPSTLFYDNGTLMMVESYHQDKLMEGQYYKKNDSFPSSMVENGTGTVSLFDEWGNVKQEIVYEKSKALTPDY